MQTIIVTLPAYAGVMLILGVVYVLANIILRKNIKKAFVKAVLRFILLAACFTACVCLKLLPVAITLP